MEKMKEKTCKICKCKFVPDKRMFCPPTCQDFKCMQTYAMKHLKKQSSKKATEIRVALKKFNDTDVNVLKKIAQKVCNTYIRLRDKDEPCISCGYNGNERQWHAGHYKPSGGFSALRFSELNIHKQCSICNNHLSGNLVLYRENLIKKIGIKEVEKLELCSATKRYSVEELQEIAKYYKAKIKDLN